MRHYRSQWGYLSEFWLQSRFWIAIRRRLRLLLRRGQTNFAAIVGGVSSRWLTRACILRFGCFFACEATIHFFHNGIYFFGVKSLLFKQHFHNRVHVWTMLCQKVFHALVLLIDDGFHFL